MAAPDFEDFHARLSKREELGVVGDAAERSLARYTPNLAPEIDDDPSIRAERAGHVIVRVVGVFLKSGSNMKLMVAGLAYAVDLAVMNQLVTMQHLAIRNGLSRSAVSKVAKILVGVVGQSEHRELRMGKEANGGAIPQ